MSITLGETTRELPTDQYDRLTALASTWEALRPYDLEALDMVRAAHWVLTGQELEVAGWPPKTPTEHVLGDRATWRAPVPVG